MPKECRISTIEVLNDYANKLSLRAISEKYGCSHETIRKRLKGAGVPLRKYTKTIINRKRRPLTHVIDLEELASKYEQGVDVKDLAIEYNCSISTIYTRLRESKVPNVPNIEKKRITRTSMLERNQKIKDHYEYIGRTFREIGEYFKLSEERIKQIVKK